MDLKTQDLKTHMSVHISCENETRLIAMAQAKGISVDEYLEHLMNEREELANIIERAATRVKKSSHEEMRAKIDRGFAQSESGEVVDGEIFSAGLLAELDDLERKQRS